MSKSVVKVDPEIMSGAPCFVGTRVPIHNLIDYLEGGDSIDEFLEDFPTVTREQVLFRFSKKRKRACLRAPCEDTARRMRSSAIGTLIDKPFCDHSAASPLKKNSMHSLPLIENFRRSRT